MIFIILLSTILSQVYGQTEGAELASLDFQGLISGPLVAAINAQTQASLSTVSFIKEVGFTDPDGGTPVMVDFLYNKGGNITQVTVPLLSMLNIPCFEIEEMTIDFNARINSVKERSSESSLGVDVKAEAKANWGFGSAKLSVSVAYQKKNREGNTVTRDYSMAIHVKAGQSQPPEGLTRILNLLSEAE